MLPTSHSNRVAIHPTRQRHWRQLLHQPRRPFAHFTSQLMRHGWVAVKPARHHRFSAPSSVRMDTPRWRERDALGLFSAVGGPADHYWLTMRPSTFSSWWASVGVRSGVKVQVFDVQGSCQSSLPKAGTV